ncbi:hypothetical protein L0F63_001832, partial [Massospora cicadina]
VLNFAEMLRRVAGIERYCNDYCDFEKRASMLLDNNILNVKLDVEVVGMASNGASPKAVSRISSCLPSFYEHYNSSTPLFSQKNTEENTFIKYPVFSETRKKAQGEPTGDDRVQDGKTCLNKFTKNNTASGLADHILIKNGIQGSSTNPELVEAGLENDGALARKRHVLNATFLHECREVPGMSDVYRFWDLRGACFHYVSNSPWQIFPMIENFFRNSASPLVLRIFEPGTQEATSLSFMNLKALSASPLLPY